MALIPLYEAKTNLRVDSSDEDALIGILLSSAEQMCKDVGRLSEDQWELLSCCVVSQAVNASVVAVTACLTIYYSGYCYLSTLFPFLILTFLAVTAIL